jgi:hypothetical protein
MVTDGLDEAMGMDEGQRRDCQRRTWKLRAAAAATRRRAASARARSRQLCAEARLQRLGCHMAGANRLTVVITARILTQHHLFP